MSVGMFKRLLIGTPFPSHAAEHERLDKVRGLAVFASDPISSNAYATEAIMSVLIVLGSAALGLTLPIAFGIVVLVALVIFSYTQTIVHYPNGGGAYIVAKDNLGTMPALTAGAALLTDYALTVAVSVSAGIRAIGSAVPELYAHRVLLALAIIVVLTVINLRGVRESGTVFAFPTYAFVGGVLLVIVIGLLRTSGAPGVPPLPAHPVDVPPTDAIAGFAFVWLLLRAFAAGCTALTGIEAISDGVAAFKKPEARNAATTMLVMGVMAMALFVGISFLATNMHLVPEEAESVLSQMTRSITAGLPGGRVLYGWVQLFTMLILVLAANTGYQDFPRLGFFLARDGFMPRWMMNRGDRLVFSSGILLLAAVAGVVVIVFQANEIAMLPLYAIGVMVSFTISQLGMVRLWGRIARIRPGKTRRTAYTVLHSETGLNRKRALNGTGALVTFVVLCVLIATKFLDGAWIIVLAIPLLVLGFRAINRHYRHVRAQLRTRGLTSDDIRNVSNVVIVPIADVHRGTLRALKYATRMSDDVRVVTVVTNDESKPLIRERWARFPEITKSMQLVFIDYEYRDIIDPIIEYIEYVNNVEFPGQLVTVVIPEFVPRSIFENLLHNQTANLLRVRLRAQPDVVVIDVPYHLYERKAAASEQPSDAPVAGPPAGVNVDITLRRPSDGGMGAEPRSEGDD